MAKTLYAVVLREIIRFPLMGTADFPEIYFSSEACTGLVGEYGRPDHNWSC
jgi:hypothetical protein